MINKYIADNKDRFLEELIEILRIPSVSADSKHVDDMQAMAEALQTKMTEAGLEKA